MDTPGVHRPLHRLNVRMVDVALDALREVDVVAADRRRRASRAAAAIASSCELVRRVGTPRVLVLNKVDLVEKTACCR